MKNHGLRRDFLIALTCLDRSSSFYQRSDALGAKYLAHLFSVLINRYGLKVWLKSAWRRFFGPGSIPSEGSLFTAMCAFRHNSTSLDLYDLQMSDIIG